VASGAVQYLSAVPAVTSLLGSFAQTDPSPGFAGRPWIFKDDRLVRLEGQSVVYGAQAVCLVCTEAGGWAVPEPLTTPYFMRLEVGIYVDPLRDAAHNITETSGTTRQRGRAVAAAVRSALHRTDPDAVLWGDLRTVGCQLLTEPQFLPDPDGDGIQAGMAYYGVLVFGASDAAL
jgi:hypothetical protein